MTAHTHDGTRTWRTGRQATTLLALLAGVFGGAASCAAPIQADMMGNAFLTALTNAGIAYDQPATTVALGRRFVRWWLRRAGRSNRSRPEWLRSMACRVIWRVRSPLSRLGRIARR